jgi:cation diffusion facilitator family transporter
VENSSPYQTIHRATLIAFACNALLCTLKLTAGYWGKFEQETARLVSVLVLATGGGILWEAFGRPVDIHDPPAFYVLIAAGFSIALKTWLYRFEQRLASQLDSAALAADALNHKADIAATSCVFVGATAIWIGGPAWSSADDRAAIIVGGIMILAARHAIFENSNDLIDRMPPSELVEHIRELANHFPNVAGVDRIAGRKTGMRYLIDLHLEVAGDMTVQQAHQLGHQVKDWLMVELLGIADIIVHIESAGHGRG